ncbi:smr domain-containing protein C1235.03 [Aspergillus udagawae]|uniref:Smr domain-containing protein C1235.03 n=1 Tax=Aspergillus udagawae TaxID=91492 RepID=A0ABQ1A2Q2_9EURO|nr:smr domain-containing protein C1235.03 [Aspergillus udagawae]GFF72134.1 smr domain-containing protein C1235.03 [Aspergillus udagawae]GFG04398.1 smr domain-containing protein C1235.03 [Aspergillus udagawae]GFG24196.1 smr domain-containing protein C1235.03 [Aspergillus udagawae]
MGDTGNSLLKELEKEYCPPLDSALFTAIVSDYDLENAAQVQQLRDTLDTLKLSAWEQEDLPFDPSGTSGLSPGTTGDADGILSERSGSQNGTAPSRETDLTSLASDFSSVGLDDRRTRSQGRSSSLRYTIGLDGSLSLSGASEDDKVGYLTDMFPSVDRFTVQHSLRKSAGDIDRAMDVLLNIAFFDEQHEDEDGTKLAIPKGIDGFGECSNGDTGRKKNRKRKGKNKNNPVQGLSSPSASGYMQDENLPVNKWDAGQKDIEFICSRTLPVLKKEAVTSAYHANGASLPLTIRSLAMAHAPEENHINAHPVLLAQVAELTQEFPSVAPTLLGGLLKITRDSTSAAGELAVAMLTRPAASSVSNLIKITAAPPPLDLDDDEPKRSSVEPRVLRHDTARVTAGDHFVASAEAFHKASAAYRRGKSDKLMGGAAAYYSSVGRDHLERAKREAAAAADALVDSQSTSNSLDLHGVSVQDAVRIASSRVTEWWDSLGDAKYMRGGEAARSGFRIITGVGRHSHDGTSRLGPAVGKLLAREGWRVEVGEGVLTVTGVVRRR